MYKNYEHFTEDIDTKEQVEYYINSEDLENDEIDYSDQDTYDQEMIVEEEQEDDIEEKIKNKEIIRLDDFDRDTYILQEQIMKEDAVENKKKNIKKGIQIIIFLIIGLLIAIIAGIFLRYMKIYKQELILEMVEPPRLY